MRFKSHPDADLMAHLGLQILFKPNPLFQQLDIQDMGRVPVIRVRVTGQQRLIRQEAPRPIPFPIPQDAIPSEDWEAGLERLRPPSHLKQNKRVWRILKEPTTCPACKGTGKKGPIAPNPCLNCDGTGEVPEYQPHDILWMPFSRETYVMSQKWPEFKLIRAFQIAEKDGYAFPFRTLSPEDLRQAIPSLSQHHEAVLRDANGHLQAHLEAAEQAGGLHDQKIELKAMALDYLTLQGRGEKKVLALLGNQWLSRGDFPEPAQGLSDAAGMGLLGLSWAGLAYLPLLAGIGSVLAAGSAVGLLSLRPRIRKWRHTERVVLLFDMGTGASFQLANLLALGFSRMGGKVLVQFYLNLMDEGRHALFQAKSMLFRVEMPKSKRRVALMQLREEVFRIEMERLIAHWERIDQVVFLLEEGKIPSSDHILYEFLGRVHAEHGGEQLVKFVVKDVDGAPTRYKMADPGQFYGDIRFEFKEFPLDQMAEAKDRESFKALQKHFTELLRYMVL